MSTMVSPAPAGIARSRSGPAAQVWSLILLLLATTHVILSFFFVNFSWIDLYAYERGLERNPYQSRVAMMPVLRMAHASPFMQHMAAAVHQTMRSHPHSPFREASPETLMCVLTSLASGYLLVGFMVWYGARKFGRLGWMPAAFALTMIAVSMSVRYESSVWYPYDFPHILLFGISSLCILEGWWLPAAVFFLADLPMRETSIFLLPLWAAVGWARGQRRLAMVGVCVLFACWLPFRMVVHHHFLNNASEVGTFPSLKIIANPMHWPQLGSAFGFLFLPLLFGARRLSRVEQAFALGAVPGLVVTVIFGVWTETRIFGEWIPSFAVLLSTETISLFRECLLPGRLREGAAFPAAEGTNTAA